MLSWRWTTRRTCGGGSWWRTRNVVSRRCGWRFRSRRRRAGRAGLSPGLTIHLLEEGRYRESPESRAFPGWGAEEIHRALNEPVMSEDTKKDLRRVGHALGEREGTAPEDDLLRSRIERRARAAELAGVVRTILRQRGLAVSDGFPAKPESLLAPSREAVLDAAFTADDETDFLLQLGSPPTRTARSRKGPPTSGQFSRWGPASRPERAAKRATRTSSGRWRLASRLPRYLPVPRPQPDR